MFCKMCLDANDKIKTALRGSKFLGIKFHVF